jgi:hypothetical protein
MKLSTDEIIAKSERIEKLVNKFNELKGTLCRTDREWIKFLGRLEEVTTLLREATSELVEYSQANQESITDFVYRLANTGVSKEEVNTIDNTITKSMYAPIVTLDNNLRAENEAIRRKAATLYLMKMAGSLAEAMDNMIEASSKEKQIDLFKKCKNSQELSAFNQAIISNPNTADKQGNPCYTFHQGSFKLIARYTKGKLNQEAHMLFIYSRMMYKGNPIISFTVEDYMAYRGLESKHRTVRQIKRGLEKLAATQFEITSKDKTSESLFSLFGIHYKNNVIRLTLTPEGQAYFQDARAFAYLPTGLLLIDSQKNPHTIPLVMKLSNLKAMNHRKPNKGDTYKVSILIENTDIPTYQHVKEKMGRRYKDKIIDVFERDMNASADILCWNYTEGSGNSWKEFKDATVSIQWIDHPQDKPAKSREAK